MPLLVSLQSPILLIHRLVSKLLCTTTEQFGDYCPIIVLSGDFPPYSAIFSFCLGDQSWPGPELERFEANQFNKV